MDTIITDSCNGIGTITFNRPQVRNAVNLEMVEELQNVLELWRQDESVKVVVFTGEGSTFLSGGDLEQFMKARGKEQALPILQKAGDLLTCIDTYSKPTIAMINGTAIGGGCEFAAACHFRYASDQAMLGFVQIGMHITSGWGGGTRLLQKLPESKALALLLTGERISAEQALQLGFIDHVCPPERLREDVTLFAEKLAAQPLDGLKAYLRMVAWKRQGVGYEERVQREIEQCAEMWGSEQHFAVVQRFLRKE